MNVLPDFWYRFVAKYLRLQRHRRLCLLVGVTPLLLFGGALLLVLRN